MGSVENIFRRAFDYAKEHSTCIKVQVGAVFISSNGDEYYSCNNGEHSCKLDENCYKAKVTGIYESCEETRKYCKSTHAEINMLKILKNNGVDPSDGILYVTRYPCRNCLIKCIEAGIKDIRFCGVSEGTTPEENARDAEDNNVSYIWYPDYDFEFNK